MYQSFFLLFSPFWLYRVKMCFLFIDVTLFTFELYRFYAVINSNTTLDIYISLFFFILPLNILSDVHTGLIYKGNGRMTMLKEFFFSTDTLRMDRGDIVEEEKFCIIYEGVV